MTDEMPDELICLYCEKPIRGRHRPWSVKWLNGEEQRPFHLGCAAKAATIRRLEESAAEWSGEADTLYPNKADPE